MKSSAVRAAGGPGHRRRASSLIFALAVGLFRGSFTETVPVTVHLGPRRPGDGPRRQGQDARRAGRQGGRRSRTAPDGTAVLHLAMDPIAAAAHPGQRRSSTSRRSTVFGAKFVQLDAAAGPVRARRCTQGQVIQSQHVTVEINTVFQQLVTVLDKIDPAKLNETLGAIATAFNGRGEKFGQTLADFNALLAKIEPSLPNLSHDIEAAVPALNAYADAAPDLVSTRREHDDDQQLDRRPAAEPRRLPGQRHRSGRHRQRRGRRQPAGADRCRCTCWCRPPTCSTEYHDAITVRHRRPRPVREVAAAVLGDPRVAPA